MKGKKTGMNGENLGRTTKTTEDLIKNKEGRARLRQEGNKPIKRCLTFINH